MIKIKLGRDSAEWVAVECASGQQIRFGTRKPSRERILREVRNAVGVSPALNEEVYIEELADAS